METSQRIRTWRYIKDGVTCWRPLLTHSAINMKHTPGWWLHTKYFGWIYVDRGLLSLNGTKFASFLFGVVPWLLWPWDPSNEIPHAPALRLSQQANCSETECYSVPCHSANNTRFNYSPLFQSNLLLPRKEY